MIEVKQDELIDDNVEKIWKSCCFRIDKQCSIFIAKLWISSICIALCAYQLVMLSDCQYQSLYSSILSSIITFWLNKK